ELARIEARVAGVRRAVETAPEGGLRAAAKSASADWDQAEWYVTSVAPSYIRVGRGLLLVE
ncbi:MAG: hypothetical protein ACXWQR_18265, partial [Ktedonobacterales bacterium]